MAHPLQQDAPEFACEVRDGCAVIRLKDRAIDTFLSAGARDRFIGLLDAAAAADDVHGVVQINPAAYGGDSSVREVLESLSEEQSLLTAVERIIKLEVVMSRIAQKFLRCPKPLIFGIEGLVTAEYFGLALAGDFRFATQDTSFSFPNLDYGLPPGAALSFFMERQLGLSRAAEVFFSGEAVTAADALSLGLLTEVVSADRLEQRCIEQVDVMARLSPAAVTATKRLMLEPQAEALEQHVQRALSITRETVNRRMRQ